MILYTKKVPEISSPTISQDSNKHLDKIEEEDHKAPPSMTTTQKKFVKEFSTSSKLVANPNSNNYNSSSVEVVPKKKKNNLEVMNELSFHDIQMEENPEQIKYDLEVAELRKEKENEVLNYFVNRSTNAAAEYLNSKMKGFISELRGVRDLPFFLYRCTMIFG